MVAQKKGGRVKPEDVQKEQQETAQQQAAQDDEEDEMEGLEEYERGPRKSAKVRHASHLMYTFSAGHLCSFSACLESQGLLVLV